MLFGTLTLAQVDSPECAERFPSVTLTLISTSDVSVSVAGVPEVMAERFASEIALGLLSTYRGKRRIETPAPIPCFSSEG